MPRHRLFHHFEKAQNDLLSALVEGPTALETFEKQWVRLSAEFDQEARLDHVDEEFMTMAHTTASIVSTLTGSFLHLENKAANIYETLSKDVQDTLATGPPFSHQASSDPKFSVAHRWLTQNIHDPYPSASIKQELAQSCELSVDSISKWFHNARRYIGWTALARFHFGGRLSAMVQAARRAYIESDDTQPLPLHIEHAFFVIRKNIDSLQSDARLPFPHTMGRDPLEGWNANPARPIVPDEQLGVTQSKGHEESQSADIVRDTAPLDESFGSPRLLSSTWDDSEEDTTPPPPIAGFKRRADSETEIEQNMQAAKVGGVRLFKRRRSECTHILIEPSSPTSELPTSLNPQASCIPERASMISPQLVIPTPVASLPSTSSSTQPSNNHLTNRKRRLSDASSDAVSKRPRNMRSGPRTQTVSDPFPRAVHEFAQDTVFLEDWYQTSTDAGSEIFINDLTSIPSPATTALNTPSIDSSYCELPVLPQDTVVYSQQVDLSDEDFRVMIASGYDMSPYFIPDDLGVLEMWSSLDDLFPSSCTVPSNLPTAQPVQSIIDLDFKSENNFQIEHNAQSLPPSLLNASIQHSYGSSFSSPILCHDVGLSIVGNEPQELTEWSTSLYQ
uniref:B1 homeodomain mating type protein n=1 Tax=Heterobasidion parviporum TaxID=207832 RepID=S5RF22_9AGAM|nr:b1 homeodomain mating type protein [Heterobasidion parviporum]